MNPETTPHPQSSSSPEPDPIPSSSSSPAPSSSSSSPAPATPLPNQAVEERGLTPAFPTPEHNQTNDPNMVIGGPKLAAEQVDPEDKEQVAPSPKAVVSSGTPAYDRSSQRETEIFDASDVVFVREGANGGLAPYPRHEAETRFVEITKRTSNFRTRDGKTLTVLELAGGDKVSIDGTTVIVTPAEGPAQIESPDLNAHAPLD